MVNIDSSKKTILYCQCKFTTYHKRFKFIAYITEKYINTKLHMSLILNDNGS